MTMEFQLIFARGLWGLPNLDLAADCAAVAEDGFAWVEVFWDGSTPELPGFVRQAGLEWIAQIHTRKAWANEGPERLKPMIASAVEGGARMVNMHTGSDFLSAEENLTPIDLAAELAQRYQIPIVHETHRGRATWSLPATQRLLELRPELRFCADLSHWTCVHESLLQDRDDDLDLILGKSWLVHARVGFTEGPQVPHWRSPSFERERNRFFELWDRAVGFARKQNRPLVLCPEFGPFPYQAVHPTSGELLADNRESNRSMAELLRQRYG